MRRLPHDVLLGQRSVYVLEVHLNSSNTLLGPHSLGASEEESPSFLRIETIAMNSYKASCIERDTEVYRDAILHLYKTNEPVVQGLPDPSTNAKTVAFIAVPSYMTASDLLGYIGEIVQGQLSHIRFLRTNERNRYMALLLFRAKVDADAFVSAFNGRTFNSVEPETAHCVIIAGISFKGQLLDPEEFPTIVDDNQNTVSRTASGKRPVAPATASLTELPTCVVCLERMDSTVTGLLTMVCDHTFHCNCISRWIDKQSTCPVCRFSIARDLLQNPEKACSTCAADKNLWMCLICGNVACGRYEAQHAIGHYERTKHAFAMDLDSSRIWDYSTDCYVHRLVQEKLGALPASSKASPWDKSQEIDHGAEFEELLAIQLESQRVFYEDQLNLSADKVKKSNQLTQTMRLEASQHQLQLQEVNDKYEALRTEHERATRNLKSAEARNKIATDLLHKIKAQHAEECSISQSLMLRIKHLEAIGASASSENSSMRKDIQDLQEQLQDLMLHLQTSQRIEALPEVDREELQHGTLSTRN